MANFNKHNCTPNQIKWLEDNNISTCDQLYGVTMSALNTWRNSKQGSQERKDAYVIYFDYCKKIFPKVNMNYYWNHVH
jgi:hypothetical protein